LIVQPTNTPAIISASILATCKKVTDSTKPIFIPIQPAVGARVNKCTYNCKEYIEQNGGELTLGWKVTEWKNVFIEFIGHAAVKTENGIFCVTPSRYDEEKILFLEDPSLSFDFSDENARLPSQSISISKHKEVSALIEIERKIKEIKCKYPVASGYMKVYGDDATALTELEKEKSKLLPIILTKTTHHNDPCFCGSGKKYRKCCQNRPLRMSLAN